MDNDLPYFINVYMIYMYMCIYIYICVCVCFHFILDFFQKQNLKHIIFVYIMLILFMIVYSVMIDRQVVH